MRPVSSFRVMSMGLQPRTRWALSRSAATRYGTTLQRMEPSKSAGLSRCCCSTLQMPPIYSGTPQSVLLSSRSVKQTA